MLLLLLCAVVVVVVAHSAGPWQALQKGWSEELNCVCFSPSGTHFIIGDNMGDLHLWDMALVKVRN